MKQMLLARTRLAQARPIILISLIVIVCFLLVYAARPARWQVYVFRDGAFQALGSFEVRTQAAPLADEWRRLVPPTWRVTAWDLADVTGDAQPEWALVVWRPWRDWPTQRWSGSPSPIAGFQDAAGASCHLILLDPRSGRELWAGSALPAPLLALAVGDVDGDGLNEVAALEGEYAAGRDGPATRANVWRWNGFGFTLAWRSPPGRFRQLGLTDVNADSILDIVVR